MTVPGTYMIICEGASECNYLEHLNRFLATLPPPAKAGPAPLRFIPRPKNIDPKSGVNIGCGGGDCTRVSRAYRRHIASFPNVNLSWLKVVVTFAQLLRQVLDANYPEVFG